MTLTIHHAPQSRSIRVLWLLEEMGLPYEVVPITLDKAFLRSDAYRQVHPLSKVPVLTDGGTRLFESLAIMDYVMGRYGPTPLRPAPADEDYGAYLQWFHFGESGLSMPVSLLIGQSRAPADQRAPAIGLWARKEAARAFALLAETVRGRSLLPRGFTAADISLGYMLYLYTLVPSEEGEGLPPPLAAYLDALKARPAWAAVAAR